jgi:hypothetical protein
MIDQAARSHEIKFFEKQSAKIKASAAENRRDALEDYNREIARIDENEKDDLLQLKVATAKGLGWRAEERDRVWVLLDPAGVAVVGDSPSQYQWIAWLLLPDDWMTRGSGNG